MNKIKNWVYHNRNYVLPHTFIRPFFRNFIDKGYKNLVGAEVGIEYGTNLNSIIHNLPIKRIHAIDIDLSKCKRFDDLRIKFYEFDSFTASNFIDNNSLDFCYIDSDHSYKHVVKEIPLYLDKVKLGGFFGGHDWNHKGVAKAVLEHFSIDELYLGGVDWWIVK